MILMVLKVGISPSARRSRTRASQSCVRARGGSWRTVFSVGVAGGADAARCGPVASSAALVATEGESSMFCSELSRASSRSTLRFNCLDGRSSRLSLSGSTRRDRQKRISAERSTEQSREEEATTYIHIIAWKEQRSPSPCVSHNYICQWRNLPRM